MLNIAIDGHASSGKSILAKLLAKKLNLKLFNTGEIYRAIACHYREMFDFEVNEKNINKLIENLKVKVEFEDDNQIVYVNDKVYTKFLREEEISLLASQISPFPQLREKVNSIQRQFANLNDCVMEGRDIGSEVLPNANYKFFITADVKVRAKRRHAQMADIDFQMVLEDLIKRDYSDEHRKVAPLKPAKDAIIIDNSELTIEETVEKCYNYINLGLKNNR